MSAGTLAGDALRPLRIAVVMLDPPLPFGSAAARWYYVLLKGLVARGHHVTAFASCPRPDDEVKVRDLFPSPEYDLRLFRHPQRRGLRAKAATLLRPFSYPLGADFRASVAGVMRDGVDVLHLEQLWTGWLGLAHRERALVNMHSLYRIDLEAWRPVSPRERLERQLLLTAEHRLLRAFPRFNSSSPRLAEPIRSINPRADLSFVPLGLDSSLYPFIPDERHAQRPTIALIGSMNWNPSRSAAERLLTRLWPEIKRCVPDATLQIVGWHARRALASYLNLPDVSILEDVADVRPSFEAASLLLYAPARGSGMKIKIVEAMAFGVPVVTTSEGVEGLPAEDGVHAGVCDDDAGLIERAVALLRDRPRRLLQRRAARELVETHCGPEATIAGLEKVYERIVEGTVGRGNHGRRAGPRSGRVGPSEGTSR